MDIISPESNTVEMHNMSQKMSQGSESRPFIRLVSLKQRSPRELFLCVVIFSNWNYAHCCVSQSLSLKSSHVSGQTKIKCVPRRLKDIKSSLFFKTPYAFTLILNTTMNHFYSIQAWKRQKKRMFCYKSTRHFCIFSLVEPGWEKISGRRNITTDNLCIHTIWHYQTHPATNDGDIKLCSILPISLNACIRLMQMGHNMCIFV